MFHALVIDFNDLAEKDCHKAVSYMLRQ